MSELKSKKIYDVLEFRYKDDHRTGPGPNNFSNAGDDYGEQHVYNIKTAREMLKFIELKKKYDPHNAPIRLTRFSQEVITDE